jgi:hypothetical protein
VDDRGVPSRAAAFPLTLAEAITRPDLVDTENFRATYRLLYSTSSHFEPNAL